MFRPYFVITQTPSSEVPQEKQVAICQPPQKLSPRTSTSSAFEDQRERSQR